MTDVGSIWVWELMKSHSVGLMPSYLGRARAAGTYLIAPQISNITGTVDGVQLSQLQFSKPLDTLSGSLQSSFDIRAAGRTPDEMLASISGPLRIKIQNALLGPLNVSDALCQAVSGNTEVIADSADTMTVAESFRKVSR